MGRETRVDFNKVGPLKKAKERAGQKIPSMTFYTFKEILDSQYDKGMGPDEIAESTKWFFNKARALIGGKATEQDLMAQKDRLKSRFVYGKMYHYVYDAKTKDTLPYWDRFPLIFPIKPQKGGFLGLNLHYLPPPLRMSLMAILYDLNVTGRYDQRAKINASYDVLQKAAGNSLVAPCIKSYLYSQVRSPFLEIQYPEWAMAAALPTQQFQKQSARKVWADSRKF